MKKKILTLMLMAAISVSVMVGQTCQVQAKTLNDSSITAQTLESFIITILSKEDPGPR